MFWPIFLRPKKNESLRDCWFLCHIFLQLSHRLPIPAFQHSPINPLRSQQHAFYWRQKECKQLLSKSLCKAVLTHQYLLHTGPELLKGAAHRCKQCISEKKMCPPQISISVWRLCVKWRYLMFELNPPSSAPKMNHIEQMFCDVWTRFDRKA